MSHSSKLFEGYKSIGLISSSVSHLIRYIEKINKIQIVTAVGRSFLVFNEKLQLVETCVAHSSDIEVLASDSKFLFTAAGKEIFAWKYGHKWKVKSYKGVHDSVTHLLVFGGQLIGIDRSNTLFCWEITSEELVLTTSFGLDSFELSTVLHPATYINKILLGSRQGTLQLWNISKQKLIFQFDGWNSAVTSLVQAPALHIVAIGHESGLIVLHHLQQNSTLMKFYQEWGPVSGLSFRTDDASTTPILVSCSSNSGHLAVWNLDQQRLEAQMRDIHTGAIVGCTFINKEPLLITNSSDNSLKTFVFDDLQTTGRLLFQREGHHKPPTRIKFYGHRGHYILSAGLDSSLRAFNIYSERLNRNLGTASFNRKLAKKKGVRRDTNTLNPIMDFSTETVREKEWDNLVACHRNTPFVTSWSFDRMKMGEHKLMHERFREHTNVYAECLCVSNCGNFVLIGYNTGHLDRFNVQSGIHRCTYGDPVAHQGIVRGVVSDELNQMVVSGGSDRKLQFWRFSQNELIGTLKLSEAVNLMHLHKENSLLAVSLDNFHLIVVDLETKRIVRRFVSHRHRITDMTFDAECRRLFVASMDSLIYVWDMLSGQLVDLFRTATPCVSLTLSPTGEFLATAHVNDLGIYLWANLSIYSAVTLKPLDICNDQDNIKLITLPQIRSDEVDNDLAEDESDSPIDEAKVNSDKEEELIDYEYRSPEQISSELVTLSTLSHSRWKNLLNLDLIRKRNKPKEPIEKPKAAPFFLPTISGLNPKFDLNEDNTANNNEQNMEVVSENKMNQIPLHMMSPFVQLLDQCANEQDYSKFFYELKSYGPSKIDVELRTLGPDSTGTTRFVSLFMQAMHSTLVTKRDYELVQSYLGLFFKIHLETISKDADLLAQCETIAEDTDQIWSRISHQFDQSLCLVNYLRNALV